MLLDALVFGGIQDMQQSNDTRTCSMLEVEFVSTHLGTSEMSINKFMLQHMRTLGCKEGVHLGSRSIFIYRSMYSSSV